MELAIQTRVLYNNQIRTIDRFLGNIQTWPQTGFLCSIDPNLYGNFYLIYYYLLETLTQIRFLVWISHCDISFWEWESSAESQKLLNYPLWYIFISCLAITLQHNLSDISFEDWITHLKAFRKLCTWIFDLSPWAQ